MTFPRSVVLCAAVACSSNRPAPQVAGPPGPAPAPRPPNPDAKVVAVESTSCGTLQAATTPCATRVLASNAGGIVTRVSESSCPPFDERKTLAGSAAFEFAAHTDGTWLLANGSRCEALPMPPDQPALVGGADGRVAYWGRDSSEARHFVARTPDATWRIAPPVRTDANLALQLWEQGGRVVAGYQSMGTEFGYYDEPTNQLRPIRRGISSSGLQLVPGVAVDEPPTALYQDGQLVVVDQPDVETGYRRIERTLASKTCPIPEGADPNRRPSGNFRDEANPILFRTPAGGLWLAYTETKGRCTYRLAGIAPAHRDPFLVAHPPPPPLRWNPSAVVERTTLVLVPVERGHFGAAKRVDLPPIELHYGGPWQFHPSVTAARVRLAIGSVTIDVDPGKLASVPPLARPWVAPPVAPEPRITVVPTPPPAHAPPFPALRAKPIATPLTMTTQREQTLAVPIYPNTQMMATCRIAPRTASEPKLVDRQIVLRCDLSRALAMAAGGDRVAFTQFSQRGYEPLVEIDRAGEVHLDPQPTRAHDQKIRFVRGTFELGDRLPPKAPPTPPGWMIYDNDGASVFATGYERGYELLRGTVDRSKPNAPVWDWQPAFPGGRTPATGQMMWPVFLRHPKGDPTIVYVADPSNAADIVVRTPTTIVGLPTWSGTGSGGYRVHELSAVELANEQLPVIAAKVDASIVLAFPSKSGYAVRAIPGTEAFTELPPPDRQTKCSEALVEREREEVYSPQLFTWNKTAGLAFLSTRIRERVRWTKVPPGCGWVVDQRTVANELAVARVDANGAAEILRVPVEYRAGTGFHGSNLLVDIHDKTLHTIATSYGTTTYTRIALP